MKWLVYDQHDHRWYDTFEKKNKNNTTHWNTLTVMSCGSGLQNILTFKLWLEGFTCLKSFTHLYSFTAAWSFMCRRWMAWVEVDGMGGLFVSWRPTNNFKRYLKSLKTVPFTRYCQRYLICQNIISETKPFHTKPLRRNPVLIIIFRLQWQLRGSEWQQWHSGSPPPAYMFKFIVLLERFGY